MPVMDGLEFLKRRDNNPMWLKIRTKLGACGYMTKPIDFGEMTKMLKAIMDYWPLSEQLD